MIPNFGIIYVRSINGNFAHIVHTESLIKTNFPLSCSAKSHPFATFSKIVKKIVVWVSLAVD
jgi:hypothetical protein